jgi:hypothetical protein
VGHPESLDRAGKTLDAMEERGQGRPERIREWREYIAAAQRGEAGMRALLELLSSAEEGKARLRDFHPFAGILTREQRREAMELCTYRH